MSLGPKISRRDFVQALLAGAAALLPSTGRPADMPGPADQGIGGTGAPVARGPDQGIGGTGVLGTIEGFGSIFINGLEIGYASDARVLIDGRPAAIEDLRIGHVAAAFVEPRDGGIATGTIQVTREVVGPVEHVGATHLIVLGQRVEIGGHSAETAVKPGDRIAVSGLRRPDGAIVASLIEPSAGDLVRLAGPLKRRADGELAIGRQRLVKADRAHLGRRLVVEGRLVKGALVIADMLVEQDWLAERAQTLSVEAYVADQAGELALGSGLIVARSETFSAAVDARGMRAILDLKVAADGDFLAEDLRPQNAPRLAGASNAARPAPMQHSPAAPAPGAPPNGPLGAPPPGTPPGAPPQGAPSNGAAGMSDGFGGFGGPGGGGRGGHF